MQSYLGISLLLTLISAVCYYSSVQQIGASTNEEGNTASASANTSLRRRLNAVYGVKGVPSEAAATADGRRLSLSLYPQQQPLPVEETKEQQQQQVPGGYGFVIPRDQQQQLQQQEVPRNIPPPPPVGEDERPTIYTYVEQAAQYDPNDDTGDLIENWRKAWYDVGWDPRILDARDAQRLPEYDELMSLITDLDLIGEKNIVFYKRWMAMASVGGGWMADISTWPLNYFIRHGRILPNDGFLTIYQGFSPSLVSGTGDEYLRVARQIGKTAEKAIAKQKMTNEHFPEKYKDHVEWNDLVALKELKQKLPDVIKARSDVVPKNKLFRDGLMQCGESEGKRAFYLADLKPTKEFSRGTIARKFLNDWRESCSMTIVEDIEVSKKARY